MENAPFYIVSDFYLWYISDDCLSLYLVPLKGRTEVFSYEPQR